MQRMADTIAASNDLYVPRWVFQQIAEDPKNNEFVNEYHQILHEMGQGELDLVRQKRVPVIEVTNCDRYLSSLDEYDIYEQFPCLAPILPMWWMEYVRPGRTPEAVGAMFLQLEKEDFYARKHVVEKLLYPDLVEEKGHFFLAVNMYFQQKKKIVGPVATFHIVCDDTGRPVEQTYELASEYLEGVSSKLDDPTLWFFRKLSPMLQGIAFAHCTNVRVDRNDASEKQQKKRKKNRQEPLMTYFTVGIEPFKGRMKNASVNADPNSETSIPLTITRGHYACVDEETEILTRRGWLRHDALLDEDEIAGYDLDTGLGKWTQCHGINRYEYDGELVAIDGRHLSMRMTPNHRTVAFRSRRNAHGPEIVPAEELRPKYRLLGSVDSWMEDGREKWIDTDLARICAWVATDGHFKGDDLIGLCQDSNKHQFFVDEIDALLQRIELPAPDRSSRSKYRSSLDNVHRYVEPNGMVRWRLPLGLSQEIRRIMPGKHLPTWFGDLPLNQTTAVLLSFVNGDSNETRREHGIELCQKYRTSLDVIQMMATRLGWKSNLRRNSLWRLTLLSHTRPMGLRLADGTSLIRQEHYRGIVWCPSTGTGTFVARRDGHVFVTGNSYGPEYGKGLLFGKIAGRFWVPFHVRGNAKNGAIKKDYEVKP